MANFKRAPMPRAAEFINADGSLTVPALNYLGNLEKLLNELQGLNGSDSAFLATASEAGPVAPVVITPVTTTYSRAGATYTVAETTTALDEIQQTTVPAINSRLSALSGGINAIIAALKAANLMGP